MCWGDLAETRTGEGDRIRDRGNERRVGRHGNVDGAEDVWDKTDG